MRTSIAQMGEHLSSPFCKMRRLLYCKHERVNVKAVARNRVPPLFSIPKI
jgi:hypothetical protein